MALPPSTPKYPDSRYGSSSSESYGWGYWPISLCGEFLCRAKLWQKGVLPDEGEERTRTVRAVNLPGRY